MDALSVPIILVANQPQILLTTDKPLYQPGQTIHVRALALERSTQTPVDAKRMRFEVEDSKGNKILHQDEETSSFGVAATSFVLGDEINLGSYTIRSTLGEVVQQKNVQVDTYTLPKWKIEATTDKSSIAPGGTLRGQVQAHYFFVKPVENADVMNRLSTVETTAQEWAQLQGKTDK